MYFKLIKKAHSQHLIRCFIQCSVKSRLNDLQVILSNFYKHIIQWTQFVFLFSKYKGSAYNKLSVGRSLFLQSRGQVCLQWSDLVMEVQRKCNTSWGRWYLINSIGIVISRHFKGKFESTSVTVVNEVNERRKNMAENQVCLERKIYGSQLHCWAQPSQIWTSICLNL